MDLQKPLTYDQVLKHKHGYLFWNDKHGNAEPCRVIPHKNGCAVWVSWIGSAVERPYDERSYGKTWRCWEHYPTEEERSAVPWVE